MKAIIYRNYFLNPSNFENEKKNETSKQSSQNQNY